MTVSRILVVAVLMALPAYAESADVERERIGTCFDERQWTCAFDGMTKIYSTAENLASCLSDTHHGCSYEMLGIMVSGIGAAEKGNASQRRAIADRAIAVIGPMSEGLMEIEGEIAFSALRYDACKATSDKSCMAESASLIRLAIANGYSSDDAVSNMAEMLGEFGVRYPLDLALVMNEVAGMEK